MKPIGQHPGSTAPTKSRPEQSPGNTQGSLFIKTTAGHIGSARIEDLIDVAPVATNELPVNQLPEPTVTPSKPRDNEAEQLAAIIELFSKVLTHRTMPDAMQCLATTLKQHLNAYEVLVGVCPEGGRASRLVATSNSQPLDALAAATRAAEAAFQEADIRGSVSCWPAVDSTDRHALMCHQQLAEIRQADQVVTCALQQESGELLATIAVLFAGEAAPTIEQQANPEHPSGTDVASTIRFLRAASPVLVCSIQSLQRSTRGLGTRLRSGLRSLVTSSRWKTIAAVTAMLTALMSIPMDYRVRCESEIQPVSRRFVAAPFAAPLKNCLVEPGDVVEEGQLLAELDGRELRWELAGITADLGKATKEHNAWLSEQDFGKAAIARHEMERLQNRSAVLSDRTRRLEVRSPIAGIIVAGDHEDSEGVPLETGQSLFEVAPLDQMLIEVAIPEDDFRHVKPGMSISLVLDSMPSETVDATIQKIHPRAELRDHENVFIAEALLVNNALQLRPGMRGSAKVSTGSRALGWNLFHKPVAHVVGWLGW